MTAHERQAAVLRLARVVSTMKAACQQLVDATERTMRALVTLGKTARLGRGRWRD